MLKKIFILLFIFCGITENGFTRDVVIREKGPDNGHNQIYVDPPQVTYDEELNELTVYFGSTGTLDIEYVDTGACSRAEPRSRLRLEKWKLLVNSPQN